MPVGYDDLQRLCLYIIQLSQQSYATNGSFAARIRVEKNDMRRLTSPGFLFVGDDSVYKNRPGAATLLSNRMDMLVAQIDRGYEAVELIKKQVGGSAKKESIRLRDSNT